ncbi:hypothetical protein [Nitrospirillum sp. BR 11163]|uniref:hypothetical protein n=1 Tax=Nitrospirillum sp. BR 11163 TaxID=3104323 RepID=UPI002AFE1632|nr:hypothetical protein [Nitrospirillum sp. BR 11163]MEA1674407.1 hypothetical protein [Nitrospirillum sp. BR 11163]
MNILTTAASSFPSPAFGGLGRELTGLSLIAYAMGRAARREGHALLSNPFDQDDALGSLGDIEAASAWRDGWLTPG